MTSEAADVHADFRFHLQDIAAKTAKQLEVLPAGLAAVDPLVHAQLRQQEENARKKAASQQRLAAIDDRYRKPPIGSEKAWREQVNERKEAERKRRALEAAQAIEEATRAEQGTAIADGSPFAAARDMWVAEAQAREQARSKAAADQQAAEEQWLQSEWEPLLSRHRQQAKAKRAAEERQKRQEVAELTAALTWEREFMAREDAASSSFVRAVEAECSSRNCAVASQAVRDAAASVLRSRSAEKRWLHECEEKRKRAEEANAQKETEEKEKEYREWRQEVRSHRCRRQRSAERTSPERYKEEQRKLELQGRDWFREQEITQKQMLDSSLQHADDQVQRMRERGGSPRRALEEARALADQQRRVRDDTEPVKVEQELWETLLAKNRITRQQERSSKTPRWGVFVSGSP